MNNIWFSSDLHMQHSRLLEFCRDTRQGKDIDEHDELLIQAWNSVVHPGDVCYIIGDECLGDRDKGYRNISRLNGSKHLIRGNHTQLKKEEHKAVFQSISDIKKISVKTPEGKKQQIIMCHFPLREWENCHHGSIHLFGHLHGNTTNIKDMLKYKCMDVGVDTRPNADMRPYSLEEVLSIMAKREIMSHH